MQIEEFKNVPGIYKISIVGTNKVYIGESIKVKSRLKKHMLNLSKQRHSNPILQNIYNKYGKDAFDFEILEYVEYIDDELLKKIEKEWQNKFKYCISLDSNKYNQTSFRQSRISIYHEGAMKTIYSAIEACKKGIIVYDIVEDQIYEFKQVKDGYVFIERKHMNKCLKSEYKIAYKNRYVAYYKSEFNGVDHEKIILTYGDTKYSTSNKVYKLYDLLNNKNIPFSSKSQVCKFLNLNHSGTSFYDKLISNNIIYWNYYSGVQFTKSTINLAEVCLRNTSSGSKRANLIKFYNCLKDGLTLVDMSNILKISRYTLSKVFKDRSRLEWISDIEKILSTLPE